MPDAPLATILIIDDTPDNIAVLFDLLREAGLRVLVCESGEAGLEAAGISPPDLILLDIMMPGLDGFATCVALKRLPDLARVPIIFMTALSDGADKVRGLEMGAVDFITKPVFPAEVLARVRTHLELRALQRELEDRNEILDQAIQQRLAAEHALHRALDRPVLVVDAADRITFITRPAARLLAAFADCLPESATTLPAPLRALRYEPEVTLPVPSGGILQARRSEPPRENGVIMIQLEEQPAPSSPQRLMQLGLTPRETEILFWIAHGKTSPEIGVILGLAKATVKKHVENILPKLGVETRLSAALLAQTILQRGD